MQVEITILVENTTPTAKLVGEYGFSALIRVDGRLILFDSGSRDAVFKNASALRVDLNAVEDVVISHGHFDHTGGLGTLVKMKGDRRFYAHPDSFGLKYVNIRDRYDYIGMPVKKEDITSGGGSLIETPGVYEVFPGVLLTGEIPRVSGYEDTGGRFVTPGAGEPEWKTDYLPDDQALIIDHPEGLIVVSGCAHSGLINTLDYARRVTGRDKIYAFLGGTHLMTANQDRIGKTIQALREYNNIERLVVCHCTGFYPAAILYREFGNLVQKGEVGFRLTV